MNVLIWTYLIRYISITKKKKKQRGETYFKKKWQYKTTSLKIKRNQSNIKNQPECGYTASVNDVAHVAIEPPSV